MLEEIRRPIRIDDWNRMIIEFNKLEKRVIELEEKTKVLDPKPEWVELTYDKFLVEFSEFFREPGDYEYGSTYIINIEDRQVFGYYKNIYVFDKQMLKDIDNLLSENKCVKVIVNIKEKEITQKKVAIKKNVDKVKKEEKPKREYKKKKGWFGL